jgi:hypothetical protein
MLIISKKIAGEKKGTFTGIALGLLRQELAALGCTMGIGREAGSGSENEPAGKRVRRTPSGGLGGAM